MPPEADSISSTTPLDRPVQVGVSPPRSSDALPESSEQKSHRHRHHHQQGKQSHRSSISSGMKNEDDGEILKDNKGRPYNLGPKGFVCDLNTRAVKIARRVVEQSRLRDSAAAAAAIAATASTASINSTTAITAAAAAAADSVCTNVNPNNNDDNNGNRQKHEAGSAAPSLLSPGYDDAGETLIPADAGTSGTVRTPIAKEIQFVLGGRLPFVKRSEFLVLTWISLSVYFIVRYGLLECGFAPTLGAFCLMFFVLDFYSGVLHVVLDDEWNMNVPLLSQPAMEFQYHHHIPDDGCSRPFVEGMGDLNFIIGLHLSLFIGLFLRGEGQDKMLLTAGAWKMLLAYWGIWNHRQAHQLNSKRPRWVTYLQNNGLMLSPAAHKVHHTPPHDDEYCLLGVTSWPVTWLGRKNLGSIFWIGLFLALTALDTVCVTKLLGFIYA